MLTTNKINFKTIHKIAIEKFMRNLNIEIGVIHQRENSVSKNQPLRIIVKRDISSMQHLVISSVSIILAICRS